MKSYIISFDSIHHVLKAEKLILQANLKIEIIPTPQNISLSCGVSIKVDSAYNSLEKIKNILQENNLNFRITEKNYP